MGELIAENQSTKEIEEINLKENVSNHVDLSIRQVRKLMDLYLNDNSTVLKADKLAYWLEDYCRFLNYENSFNPSYLKSYKRGDVIKANLGYNIGNEEGGLHYCLVANKNNAKSSGVITVIPLTSFKGKPVHYTSVFLGDEIYQKLKEKYDNLMLKLSHEVLTIKPQTSSPEELASALQDLQFARKVEAELNKMKKGSIALVSQMTTISKQRIYDPQKNGDILSGLRLSEESLDLINNKIKELFVK